VKALVVIAALSLFGRLAPAGDLNSIVLEQMRKMPAGGQYSTSHIAKIKLQSAAHFESGKFFVIPQKPYVSFCSGAT
jgi:hypothetical protein